jgi:hypothetical protein
MEPHIYDRAIQFVLNGYEGVNDPIIEFITKEPENDLYRLGIFTISGETKVVFSRPLRNRDYHVTVKRYTADNGVVVEYGWAIKDLEEGSFIFTPPTRFNGGTLIYEARYYK